LRLIRQEDAEAARAHTLCACRSSARAFALSLPLFLLTLSLCFSLPLSFPLFISLCSSLPASSIHQSFHHYLSPPLSSHLSHPLSNTLGSCASASPVSRRPHPAASPPRRGGRRPEGVPRVLLRRRQRASRQQILPLRRAASEQHSAAPLPLASQSPARPPRVPRSHVHPLAKRTQPPVCPALCFTEQHFVHGPALVESVTWPNGPSTSPSSLPSHFILSHLIPPLPMPCLDIRNTSSFFHIHSFAPVPCMGPMSPKKRRR
jgi:hypothetical protein